MFEIKGKYASALITTDNIEEEAIGQITELVNNEASANSKVVIMMDVHAGKGCTIGTTMTIKDRVVPNICGVDIGCGLLATRVPTKDIDLKMMDEAIHRVVPSGMSVHEHEVSHPIITKYWLDGFITPLDDKQKSRALKSIGTLGGGNHFISCDMDEMGNVWLIIHTGSRNLGKVVAEYHQKVAIDKFKAFEKEYQDKISSTLNYIHFVKDKEERDEQLMFVERYKEILKRVSNKDLAYLVGDNMREYLDDMVRAQLYASINRKEIAKNIFKAMGWKIDESTSIETIHNYVDRDEMILRKGAVSSLNDFLVPLNMRDGVLILKGKANEAWNDSAPHGAGRAMSRSKAKSQLNLEDFKSQMVGVYSSTINQGTLDEAPDAYKPSQEIIDLLLKEYELIAHVKPIYNFKASE